MNMFNVGQRVRLLDLQHQRTEYQATIWRVGFLPNGNWSRGTLNTGAVDPHDQPYLIDIDGVGKVDIDGLLFAAPHHMLEPIVPPPDVVTWAQCPWMPSQSNAPAIA